MKRLIVLFGCITLSLLTTVRAQNGIDPEALISRILAVDKLQRDTVKDVTYDAEYIEGELDKENKFVEKVKLTKKIYLRFLKDTTLFAEEYIELYEEGKRKSEKELREEAKERKKKKVKRKALDISFPMLRPFYPEFRSHYKIEYKGIAPGKIDNKVCHLFQVTAIERDERHFDGEYYFESDQFHLMRVKFSPAKLVKKALFKMKQLKMSIKYGPSAEGFWFPQEFHIEGKGKAMFFISVKFAGAEYYRNPIVNSGLSDLLFTVDKEDD